MYFTNVVPLYLAFEVLSLFPSNLNQEASNQTSVPKQTLPFQGVHKKIQYSLESIQRLLRSSEVLRAFVVDEPEASRGIGLAVPHYNLLRACQFARLAKAISRQR